MNTVHRDSAAAENNASTASTGPEPPPASTGAILLAAARTGWDRLGLVLAVSLTWAAAVSLPFTIERWLPRNAPIALHFLVLALIPLLAAVPTAGAFRIFHRVATYQEAQYVHFWQDGYALIGPAVRLMVLQAGSAFILFVTMTFYLRVQLWMGRVGLTVCAYALLLWAMMLIYQWPLLIAQEAGVFDEPDRLARRGAFAAIRRSFFLALARPFFTVGVLAILLLISALMTATIVMPALIGLGVIALVTTALTRALLVQLRVLPPPIQEEPVPDLQFRLGGSSQKSEARSHE